MRGIILQLWVIGVLCMPTMITAQGLFETAGVDSSGIAGTALPAFTTNGYIKSALFGGQKSNNEPVFKAIYTELSLKLSAQKANIGRAFADVRLKTDLVAEQLILAPDIREAWIAITPGRFDIRFGRQILSWGRAGGDPLVNKNS
jgi:hypothetical protein